MMTSQITPGAVLPMPLASFVQTAFAAAEKLPATVAAAAPPSAPLRRTLLVNEIATRSTANLVGTAQVLSENPSSDTVSEIYEMQAAFVQQLFKIDQDWRTGLMRLYEGSMSLRKANTLSKVVEQDFNLAGQYGDLLTNYMTSMSSLFESTNVGYSFWLNKKIQANQAAKADAANSAPRLG